MAATPQIRINPPTTDISPVRGLALETWIQEQVAPAYDALQADPARVLTADQVRASLAEEHAKATAKR